MVVVGWGLPGMLFNDIRFCCCACYTDLINALDDNINIM